MCRVLAYTGHPILLDELLFQTNSSLVQQTFDPQQLGILNLGGFGLVAWDPDSRNAQEPWVYRSVRLPIFDANLKALSTKVGVTCLLAHVRGIPYRSDAGFGEHNLHPFRYPGFAWSMAHNGDLANFLEIKHPLLTHTAPEIVKRMAGSSDSEAIYALVMSQLNNPREDRDCDQLIEALLRAMRILRQVRQAHGISLHSSANLVFTNGTDCVALRFAFNFGCYPTDEPASVMTTHTRYLSLWYTVGERFSKGERGWSMSGDPERSETVIIASEPLTHESTGWVEVPEYTILKARRSAQGIDIDTIPVDV